jgi:hypothetical protein
LIELRKGLTASEIAQLVDARNILGLVTTAAENSPWDWIILGRVWQRMLDRRYEGDIERGMSVVSGANQGGRGRAKLSFGQRHEIKRLVEMPGKKSANVQKVAKEFSVSTRTIWRCLRDAQST